VQDIKPLFNFDPPVTAEEVRAASLQLVRRKISGFNKPCETNEALFLAVVDEIAGISVRLIHSLETIAPPKNREEVSPRGGSTWSWSVSRSSPIPVGQKPATAGPASAW
jgi:hypothetical protein